MAVKQHLAKAAADSRDAVGGEAPFTKRENDRIRFITLALAISVVLTVGVDIVATYI
jgi:hypothetical protein